METQFCKYKKPLKAKVVFQTAQDYFWVYAYISDLSKFQDGLLALKQEDVPQIFEGDIGSFSDEGIIFIKNTEVRTGKIFYSYEFDNDVKLAFLYNSLENSWSKADCTRTTKLSFKNFEKSKFRNALSTYNLPSIPKNAVNPLNLGNVVYWTEFKIQEPCYARLFDCENTTHPDVLAYSQSLLSAQVKKLCFEQKSEFSKIFENEFNNLKVTPIYSCTGIAGVKFSSRITNTNYVNAAGYLAWDWNTNEKIALFESEFISDLNYNSASCMIHVACCIFGTKFVKDCFLEAASHGVYSSKNFAWAASDLRLFDEFIP